MAVIEDLLPRQRVRRRERPRLGRRVVRPAHPSEAAVLSCLHRSLTQDLYGFEVGLDSDPTANGSITLVCEVSEAIAGYLCVGDPRVLFDAESPEPAGVDSSWWQLRALGVAPQFRRTGVATDLWRASLARIPGAITHVCGDVRTDKNAAMSWYRARGFDADPIAPVAVPEPAHGRESIAPGSLQFGHFHGEIATLRANLGSSRTGPRQGPTQARD